MVKPTCAIIFASFAHIFCSTTRIKMLGDWRYLPPRLTYRGNNLQCHIGRKYALRKKWVRIAIYIYFRVTELQSFAFIESQNSVWFTVCEYHILYQILRLKKSTTETLHMLQWYIARGLHVIRICGQRMSPEEYKCKVKKTATATMKPIASKGFQECFYQHSCRR